MRIVIVSFLAVHFGLIASLALAQSPATTIRVASVTPAPDQHQVTDKAVIFYEDFDRLPDWRTRFFEYVPEKESFIWTPDTGLPGGAMRCQFEKGQVSAGGLKELFGKNPFGRGLRRGETFREIYWRVYVKHEPGWEGNPAKLARATCLAGSNWSQGFIAHVWGGKGDALCIDPATGIRDNSKVTTAYNDFPHLKWLGSRQGQTPIFSPAESGRWVCIESHVKLNTPGERDGVFDLWIDGRLEAARNDLDWHGSWGDYAINAVFLENYWNQGSAKRQARWFDHFVISTQPIGPITASKPPTILRTGSTDAPPWEVEVATDPNGEDVVWKSRSTGGNSVSLAVDAAHGTFQGSRTGEPSLKVGVTHWVRIRLVGEPEWSPWHTPFR